MESALAVSRAIDGFLWIMAKIGAWCAAASCTCRDLRRVHPISGRAQGIWIDLNHVAGVRVLAA